MSAPVDHAERTRGVHARENLLVDAGAGTGKTKLIVDRLLHMVAPDDDGPATPLDRIAAVTFTRRAAGELRFRVRAELLTRLANPGISATKQKRLEIALGTLDAAFIGTIHSFADRLLRLYPVESGVSPSYVIEEDATDTMEATYRLMLGAAQNGTLAAELAGTDLEARAEETTATLLDALAAGIRATSEHYDTFVKAGLDLLVQRLLEHRDVVPRDLAPARFEQVAFDAAASEVRILVSTLKGNENGEKLMRRLVRMLAKERTDATHYGAILGMVYEARRATKQKDFADKVGKTAWKRFHDEGLADALLAPILRWLAHRLVRIAPVAAALYERVKASRGSVDAIDLLVKLRDLCAADKRVRGELQQLFAHVFVDEFQDTDPLQAEIMMFLCEEAPVADRWEDVVLAKNRITIVGDPKQSIYRFRRADVALYDAVRAKIATQPHEAIRLSANFRSVANMIAWQNSAFAPLLGAPPEGGAAFDPATGTVFHQPLDAGRADAPPSHAVHVLPYLHEDGEPANADDARELEAEATAHYLRWLCSDRSGVTIFDPVARETRPVQLSDVAILALVTTKVPLLLRALDRVGIAYAASGGRLFLSDPVHQQFILGLRALADRDDGVAVAALMQPPFFALDLQALVDERAGKGGADVLAAKTWITEARRERFSRSPGQTARALLGETGFGRTIAIGPNGEQRVAMLEELCLQLDVLATTERLDFDAATARLVAWIRDPIQLDAPRPIAREAVQVMTVHQSKGLEFPVVVLWDGMGTLKAPTQSTVFTVDRQTGQWSIELAGGLKWEEPASAQLLAREQMFANAERRRLVYVAATRARDLLVLPRPQVAKPDGYRSELLVRAGGEAGVLALDPWREKSGASWSAIVRASERPRTEVDDADCAREAWVEAERESRKARARPVGISTLAHRSHDVVEADIDDDEAPVSKVRPGRHGPVFGTTVHAAIAIVVEQRRSAADAVRRAARATALDAALHPEAIADVERALDALRAAGLLDAGIVRRFEYPVGALVPDGDGHALAFGYIDFVAATEPMTVIDFKTDRAPEGDAASALPHYARQVRTYGQILRPDAPSMRCGLLFTESGKIAWV